MSYNQSYQDDPDVFLICLGIILGFSSCVVGLNAMVEFPERRKLLDQYALSGVHVNAIMISHHVTIRRTNFIETSRKHEIAYVYEAPSSEVISKKSIFVVGACSCETHQIPPPERVFPVLVLPGFPKSGIPKSQVDCREHTYGTGACVCRIVAMVVGMFLGTVLFSAGIPSFSLAPMVVNLVAIVLGGPCACMLHGRWQKTILEGGEIQHGSSRREELQTAQVRVMEEGDEVASNVPFATAVPVASRDTRRVPLPDPLAEDIYQEAQQRSFVTLLDRLDDFRDGQWDLRAAYLRVSSEYWPSKTLTPLNDCPDTAIGNLFKGCYFIHRSWDIRGSGRANTVSQASWTAFHQGLKTAREALLRAAEQDPEDPTPYALLAGAVSMGLQVSKEQSLEWFEAAVARDANNLAAYFGRLNVVCKKWGGSHEEMRAVARASPDKVLLYQAFYEEWLWHKSFESNAAAANKFRRDSAVIEETLQIYRECLEAEPVDNLVQVKRHAAAVQWLVLCGCKVEAMAELEKLRPYRSVLDGMPAKLVGMGSFAATFIDRLNRLQ